MYAAALFFRSVSASFTSFTATPSLLNCSRCSSKNFFFAAISFPKAFQATESSFTAEMAGAALLATDFCSSSVAFRASFALLTNLDITPTRAATAAAIQPKTGTLLMAAPTILKAPASPVFATVPAVAAAFCAVCATVAAPMTAGLLAISALYFSRIF